MRVVSRCGFQTGIISQRLGDSLSPQIDVVVVPAQEVLPLMEGLPEVLQHQVGAVR